jgi:hypothetical protein
VVVDTSSISESEGAEDLPADEVVSVLAAGVVEGLDDDVELGVDVGVDVGFPSFEFGLPSVMGGGGQTIVTVVVAEKLSCFELSLAAEDVTLEGTAGPGAVDGASFPAADVVEDGLSFGPGTGIDSVFVVQVRQCEVVDLS